MNSNWKAKALIIGGLVGALTGLGATYIMVQRSEDPPEMGATDGIKLGLLLLGLVRQVGDLGSQKEIELEDKRSSGG
ncbi:MAG: hypothetical protein BMS9Abin28_2509 [Anaerolineae bacterium]|nr:MAG: hypothetical protein BMS9Abin28_2509 [Anaerolineae bacterium]